MPGQKYVPHKPSTVVLDQILGCLRVDNSRVVERALFLFKDDTFLNMLTGNSHTIYLPLLSALLRGGEPFWNPTVTKASKAAQIQGYVGENASDA